MPAAGTSTVGTDVRWLVQRGTWRWGVADRTQASPAIAPVCRGSLRRRRGFGRRSDGLRIVSRAGEDLRARFQLAVCRTHPVAGPVAAVTADSATAVAPATTPTAVAVAVAGKGPTQDLARIPAAQAVAPATVVGSTTASADQGYGSNSGKKQAPRHGSNSFPPGTRIFPAHGIVAAKTPRESFAHLVPGGYIGRTLVGIEKIVTSGINFVTVLLVSGPCPSR